MTGDNANKSRPIEVRKPWRKTLPGLYVERIDALKAAHSDVKQICSVLSCMSNDLRREAVKDCGQAFQLESVADNISAALVLLGCAEDKLMDSFPLEELTVNACHSRGTS